MSAEREHFQTLLTAEYRREMTDVISREKTAERIGLVSAMAFRLGHEVFALPLRTLREVTQVEAIRSVPHRREKGFLGISNVRGEFVMCFSLPAFLGMDDQIMDKSSKLKLGLIVECTPITSVHVGIASNQQTDVLFLIHEALGIIKYSPLDIQSVPSTLEGQKSYLSGVIEWNSHKVACLNDDLLRYSLSEGLT